jgi:hypothetical protein
MLAKEIKASPHGSFKLYQLCKSVVICEAPKDPHGWGNGSEDEPAFMTYLGCKKDEVAGYIKTFNTFYRCYWCEVRKPKYLKEFEAEIKIREMQRYADFHAFGLDYLVESQAARHGEIIDFDEYNYYTTGYIPK